MIHRTDAKVIMGVTPFSTFSSLLPLYQAFCLDYLFSHNGNRITIRGICDILFYELMTFRIMQDFIANNTEKLSLKLKGDSKNYQIARLAK